MNPNQITMSFNQSDILGENDCKPVCNFSRTPPVTITVTPANNLVYFKHWCWFCAKFRDNTIFVRTTIWCNFICSALPKEQGSTLIVGKRFFKKLGWALSTQMNSARISHFKKVLLKGIDKSKTFSKVEIYNKMLKPILSQSSAKGYYKVI